MRYNSLPTAVLLAATVLALFCATTPVAAQWTPTLLLPDLNGSNSQHPSITGDGSKMALGYHFGGARNIWTVLADGSNLTQVTQYPALFNGDERPALSDDGSKIVYASNADPLGSNVDGNKEVFTVNADGSGLTQITNTLSGGAFHPSISGNGALISFNFFGANLTGGNPDLNTEVYVAAFNGSGLVQITNTNTPSGASGHISGDGSTVIWSDAGFGLNTVYRVNSNGSGTVALVTQTNAFVLPRHAVADNASLVVFSSNDNPFGANPDGNREIFTVHAITGVVTQVTQTVDVGGLGNANLRPFISGDGSRIFFLTQNDITGQNPDFNAEIFSVNPDGSGLIQITSSTQPVPTNIDFSYISLADDGMTMAVVAGNFDGQNPGIGPFSLWLFTDAGGQSFIRGDCNVDTVFNIADPVHALGVLFLGLPGLCGDACDTNDDGVLGIADPIAALNALFSGGANPPAPFPACGGDATPATTLGCAFFPLCP